MSNETKNEPKGFRELAEMAVNIAHVMDDETARDGIEAELRKRLEPLLAIAEDLAWHVDSVADNVREMRKELQTWR